jgi:biotin carboxyl carrier protein
MDKNGHPTDTEQVANGALPDHDAARGTEPPAPPGQNGLYEEVGQLRLEVERLRDQQQALQRSPASNDKDASDKEKDKKKEGDDAPASAPHDYIGALRRHPVRLGLALVATVLLCVVGLRFWNYLQSYESTDDAEIDGHLDPISARIDGTVVHVYVENTAQVAKGQALVDLDPRDYQVAVESAAANLAQAKQAVKAAQQNHTLRNADLAATVATNAKAQVDVGRYGELLQAGRDCARDQ